jgi:hypothetical protein
METDAVALGNLFSGVPRSLRIGGLPNSDILRHFLGVCRLQQL